MNTIPRRAQFIPYRPKTILNKGKRADHWFWTRYSAYPYLGCQHDCQFCYCRERKYSPYDDPLDFAYVIKVKENAADLLRRSLRRVSVDAVFTGDYQPAERKFGISRQMLEVCLELGFPVFVLERSVLVLRDLDLLKAIHLRARAIVAFSIISTPDSPNYARVRQMERLAPPPEKRFAAMEKIAAAGIPVGTVFMPILPGLCDDEANLQNVVRWTAEHGGQFVLPGGLTLSDQQKDYVLSVLNERMPDLIPLYQTLYPIGSYSPAGWNRKNAALRVRDVRAKGKTVLLTTHFVKEAERLCDRVAILDHGKIVALDTPAALIRGLGVEERVVFSVDGGLPPALEKALAAAVRLEVQGERVVVHGKTGRKARW